MRLPDRLTDADLPGPVDRYVVPVVWNRASRRPRLPVRLVLTVALFAAALFVVARIAPAVDGLVGAVLGGLPETVRRTLRRVAAPLALAAVVVVLVALAGWLFDRRRVGDFGLRLGRPWYRDLAAGLALGALLMTGVFLVELALGWITITGLFASAPGRRFLPAFLSVTAIFLAVGVYEELLARGYLLTNLAEGLQVGPVDERWGVVVATLLTAALFGLVHAGNPNASPASTAGIALAGVLLGLGYALTGELAFPVGLHVTWNAFQGLVYGFPVSGLSIGASVVALEQSGPRLWTGGQFGPEAGLVGVLAVLVGVGMTAAYARATDRGGVDRGVGVPDLRWLDGGDAPGQDRE